MKIIVRNICKRALMELATELGDCMGWLQDEELVDSEYDLYDITFTEGVIVKANTGTIWVDSMGRKSSFEIDDCERIEII